MFITKRVIADIKAKELANGMHSVIGKFKKIIMKGVMIAPPPMPPAVASMFIKAISIIPEN